MRKVLIALSAMAVVLTACNQAEQKEKTGKEHDKMEHNTPKSANVMMDAMDKSMMDMHHAKMTGNADYDFASMMIPHHEGAVVMAEAVVADGISPELIAFSKKVIEAQQKEIKMLSDFLKTASDKSTENATEFKNALDASMVPMMKAMEKAELTNNVDKDFVALMIPHHQSAVDMAKAYLPYSNNDKIRAIAEQILSSQQEEIIWLKAQ